jgi:hypothetical protein
MKKFLVILLVSLFLLTACSQTSKTPTSGFIGGKEGIVAVLSVVSTAGNNNIFDNGVDPFKVQVDLQNKGEYDIKNNELLVTLDGINFNAFQIKDASQKNTIPLPGLRREAGKATPPSQAIIQYDANYKPNEDADRSVDLAANVCYKYQTIARVIDLCLRKRVTGPITTPVCNIEGTKTPESSGSPFKITTFTQRPAGENKVSIYVEAENQGKGTIYSKEFLSGGKCIDDEKDKNKLFVKVDLTEFPNSASMIKCTGFNGNNGFVNVIQNKIQMFCEIDTSSLQDTTFETPVRLTFDYVYKDSVATKLTIKSSI